MTKTKPLPKVEEDELREILEEYDDDEVTLYTVHAVAGWTKTDKRRFDSWTLLKQTADGEEEELMHKTPQSNGDKPGKELIKDEARKLARENRPAIVNIENRDFETQRIEVAE